MSSFPPVRPAPRSVPLEWRTVRSRASRAGAGMGAGWSVRRRGSSATSAPRFLLGSVVAGVGTAFVLASGQGANSWDVLGVALASVWAFPLVAVFLLVGVVNLTIAMLLGQRPGPTTLVPTLVYGPVVEATLWALPHPAGRGPAAAMFAVGFALIALGAGSYLTSGHRPGPVDLLFRGMASHGIKPWQARLSVEGTALAVGALLGGPLGLGTAVLTIGLAFAIPAVTDALPAVRPRGTSAAVPAPVAVSAAP